MSSLDSRIDQLSSQLSVLSDQQVGLYFAACAERMLPLYEGFHLKEGWGDPEVLRDALSRVWASLSDGSIRDAGLLIEKIEGVTPHLDDFDNLASTEAQDACIVVDAAIRALHHEPVPEAVEYVFEPLRTALCLQRTGFLQLGSGPEFEEFEKHLIEEPAIRRELGFHEDLLRSVREWRPHADPTKLRLIALASPMEIPPKTP